MTSDLLLESGSLALLEDGTDVLLEDSTTGFPYLTWTVEVAFVADPYGTLTWTDVTDYTNEGRTGRGRNYELGKVDAGTASFVFDNADGRFDPTNTASPYYPYVLPFRPVRVRAAYLGTTYNVWRGFIKSWPQTWSQQAWGTVAVNAVDGTASALNKIFGRRYTDEVTADTALRYWRLNEASGTGNFLDVGGTQTIFSAAPGHTSVTGLVAGSPDTASEFAAPMTTVNYGARRAADLIDAVALTADWTVEVIAKPVTVPTDSTRADVIISNTGVGGPSGTTKAFIRMQFGASAAAARYQVQLYDSTSSATVPVTLSSSIIPTAGRADHIVITRSGTTLTVYINGTNVGTATLTAAHNVSFPTDNYIGHTGTTVAPFKMHVDELAVYGTALSSDRVFRHYTSMLRPQEFSSELSSSRVSSILDAVNWPTADRSLDTGLSTLLASGSVEGSRASDLLQTAADAELGVAFVDGQGRFIFHNRTHRNGAASVATFGDSAALGANLLTENQSSVETDTTGLQVRSNCSIARTTAWSAAGIASLALTSLAAGDMFASTSTGTSGVAVTPGLTYTGLVTTRAATVARDFQARISWYTAAGALISSPAGTSATNSTSGGGVQASVTGVAPGTAAYAAVDVYIGGTGGAGEVHYADKLSLHLGSSTDWSPGGGVEVPYLEDVTIDYDDTYIYNDIQVSQTGTTVVGESQDTTSQTSYGLRVFTRDTPLSSTSDLDGQAATLLAWYKDPRPRVPQVSMEGVSTPACLPQMLGREISDLVTVKRRPPNAPAITIACFIDGVSHAFMAGGTWTTTFMLTPQLPDTTY